MAIQQTTLPSPAGNGYGAWTDISTYGALKTILCNGGVRCFTEVEISNEAPNEVQVTVTGAPPAVDEIRIVVIG